jgi:hypothetical protein
LEHENVMAENQVLQGSRNFPPLCIMASSSSNLLTTVLAAFGTLIATYYAYNIFSFLYLFLFHRSTILHYLQPTSTSATSSTSRDCSWALITGTSDSIGMGFAHELASEGFNIILHGHSPTKLATVEATLKAQYPHISTCLFVLDVYLCSVSAIDDYVCGLAKDSLCIHILVNNIGSSTLVILMFRLLTQLTAEDVQKLF